MNKKVVLHGAVNSSNFGDCLFVSLFYKLFSEFDNIDPVFLEGKYGISEFNRREIGYLKRENIRQIKKADALIYISGGYFGDDNSPRWMSLRRWFRYFWIGDYFASHGKPIIISGVGGGQLKCLFTKNSVLRIMNSAKSITVRDQGTKEYFQQNVKTSIALTNDTALVINNKMLPELDDGELKKMLNDKGKHFFVFLHLTGNETKDATIIETIVPAINKYINEKDNVRVIAGFDCLMRDSIIEACKERIGIKNLYFYKYTSSWQLCSLLDNMDMVISCKLHVGIVSCSLEKNVLSFPIHPYKTKRFFNGINESDRCIPLSEINSDIVYEQIIKHMDSKVLIPENARELAHANLEICKNYINDFFN